MACCSSCRASHCPVSCSQDVNELRTGTLIPFSFSSSGHWPLLPSPCLPSCLLCGLIKRCDIPPQMSAVPSPSSPRLVRKAFFFSIFIGIGTTNKGLIPTPYPRFLQCRVDRDRLSPLLCRVPLKILPFPRVHRHSSPSLPPHFRL